MKRYSEEWHAINTLLAYLHGSGDDSDNNVVTLVRKFYAPYDNFAPAILLKQQIAVVQKLLDDAEKICPNCGHVADHDACNGRIE